MRIRLALTMMIVMASVLFGVSASAIDCPRGTHPCGENTCCED